MKMRNVLLGLVGCAATAMLLSCGGGGGDSGTASTTYTVGGTVSGSVGPVVLRLNGGPDLSITAPGAFAFPNGLDYTAAYAVTVSQSAQNCNVTNGTGTVGLTNVTNVTITCTTVVRAAALNGAQESTPTGSTATGRGAVIVNPTTKEITGGMTFTGITPTAGGHHIHQAPAGQPNANGPVIIGLVLAPGGGVATIPAGTVLTDAQYASLLAGELYFNVHSVAFPGGEIRGPITLRTGITAGLAALDGAHETPVNVSTATGRGTIVFDSTTRDVLIAYTTHNVVNDTVAHIHTGTPGVSGPANVISLTRGTGIYTAPSPSTLTVQSATDMNAGNTYFNVHSPAPFAAGEIRGQIAVQ